MSYQKKCPLCSDGIIHRRGSTKCRKCHINIVSPWTSKEERNRAQTKRKAEWFQQNKEKIKKRIKKNREKNPDLTRETDFKYFIKYKYGILYEKYEKMLIEQQYQCKICGSKGTKNKRRLQVDHNHKTGQIRGLLCFNCNTGLGKFNDDHTNLKKATDYLLQYETSNDTKNTFNSTSS